MPRVVIRKEAEADIAEASAWYERQQAGLGHDFLSEIEASIVSAANNPLRYPRLRRDPEVRRVLAQRFPYRVFFIRREQSIVVFRVLHSARHDRAWTSDL